jgi:hypothetical protein
MESTKEFKLSDFYQSVILKTIGFPLIRLERGQGKFVVFVFDDSSHRAEITLNDYWNRKTSVVARDLIENINELRTRLHERINK